MTKTPPEPEWADEKYITARFGLTHTPLYNLRKAGIVRSLSSRGEGDEYGKRLFNIASVQEYLKRQEEREIERLRSGQTLRRYRGGRPRTGK